jgi:hypothetical protein
VRDIFVVGNKKTSTAIFVSVRLKVYTNFKKEEQQGEKKQTAAHIRAGCSYDNFRMRFGKTTHKANKQ